MKLIFVLAIVSLAKANVFIDLDKDDYDISNSRDFTGKVALVTGSNSGIGEGIVKLLSTLGADIVVTGRNAETVKKVAEEVEQLSPKKLKPLQVVGDLTKEDDVKRLVDQTVQTFGKIDILVNNAGSGAVSSITDPKFMQTFDSIFNIDLRASVLVNHLAVPHLLKTNGTIIHISSIASSTPSGSFMPYSMAKISLDMMTRCLAVELGPLGVRVNTINPGATKTNFNVPVMNGTDADQFIDQVIKLTPLRREGQPIDIAKAVAFLASSDASFITGANLVIDGGLVYTAGGILK